MKKYGKTMKRFWPLYLMFMPGVVYLFINCYIPMFGIQIAFRQYNARDGIYGSPWCGLNNFSFLFRTNDAFIMIRNTLLYNLVFIALGTVLAVAIAIILNEVRSKRAKQFYQTIILIPYLISMVIVSYLAFAFLSSGNGYINNSLLASFGIDAIDWYNTPKYWPVILVIINVWKNLGYNMILFMAALASIPKDILEVATLESAKPLQTFFYIKIRYLSSTLLFVTIMSLINSFKVFREVYLLTGDYPYDSIYTLQHFMNNKFRSLDYQTLSAAAILMALVMIAIIGILFVAENRFGRDVEG